MPFTALVRVRREHKEENGYPPAHWRPHMQYLTVVIHIHKEGKVEKPVTDFTLVFKELTNSCLSEKAALGLYLQEKSSWSFFF